MESVFYRYLRSWSELANRHLVAQLDLSATATPSPDVAWLERHMNLTLLFVALGSASFVMVLAPPDQDSQLPDLEQVRALRFPPACGLLLHIGTWHDFPIAVDKPVTLLIANSAKVVDALQTAGKPRELYEGDIFKISLPGRFGLALRPAL